MADTQRSLAALQALLADNTTGQISAQDLRDALVSVLGGYGSVSVQDGAVAQVVGTAAAKLTCFAANGVASGATPDHADDEISVDVGGVYLVHAYFSFTGTASRTFQLRLRVNGVEVSGAGCRAKTDASGNLVSTGFALPIALADGAVVSVYAEADVDASSITVVDGALSLERLS